MRFSILYSLHHTALNCLTHIITSLSHRDHRADWEYKSFCREDSDTSKGKSQNGVYGACKTGIGPSPYTWRTFAEAVAGNATSVYYNTSTRFFELKYKIDPRITLPTVIRLSPPQNYPAGFAVEVTPKYAARAHVPPTGSEASLGGTALEVHTTALARFGESVTVTVVPKPVPLRKGED
jgi:hypothetical protein